MFTFSTENIGRIVIIHLSKGEDILLSVKKELERLHLKNGILVSAIGSLRCAGVMSCVYAGISPVQHPAFSSRKSASLCGFLPQCTSASCEDTFSLCQKRCFFITYNKK